VVDDRALGLIAWFIAYTILYPSWPMPFQTEDGEGYTKGILGWTSIEEYKKGRRAGRGGACPVRRSDRGHDRRGDPPGPGLTQYTLASSKVLFGDYCAVAMAAAGRATPAIRCWPTTTGSTAASLAKITETITNGRKGAMTAHANILTEQEVDTMAKFVVEMAEGGEGSEEGWALYNAKGCRPVTAEGNGVLATLPNGDIVTVGAANLTDSIWRFEPGGYESAKHTILYGVNQPGVEQTRDAVMPGFAQLGQLDGKLTPDQIKMLTVYVHQLGGGQ
jgi:cytochrome c oxidase cbb3-type subunit 3